MILINLQYFSFCEKLFNNTGEFLCFKGDSLFNFRKWSGIGTSHPEVKFVKHIGCNCPVQFSINHDIGPMTI